MRRTQKEFEEDLAYGKVAEVNIANFFLKKGYDVSYAEDYGVFLDEFPGPRIFITYPNNTINNADYLTGEYLIAPDLMITKGKIRGFIEVKRREIFSLFNGEEIFYLDERYWKDYCQLEFFCKNLNYGNSVIIYLCVDSFRNENNIVFHAPVSYLEKHIQYRERGKFVSFNLKDFKRL